MNNVICEIDRNNTRSIREIVDKVCQFMNIEKPILFSKTMEEMIKEICVAKLCKVLGIKCTYNYRNEFFSIFSTLTAEVIVRILDIKINIAPYYLSCVKFDGINFIEKMIAILASPNKEKAIFDAFNFVNKYKHLIPNYKKV